MSSVMTDRNILVKHHIPPRTLRAHPDRSMFAPMSLKTIRIQRGLTQQDLAEMVGVEQSTLSKIENGFDGVTLRMLKKLADALGVDVVEIIGDSRTQAERALVDAFRHLPPERQDGWLDMVSALLPSREPGDR